MVGEAACGCEEEGLVDGSWEVRGISGIRNVFSIEFRLRCLVNSI